MKDKPVLVFTVLLVSQFCGTSLWFAGNALLPQLQLQYNWESASLGYLTSSVQLGFIIGTLSSSLLGLSDKFSPSKVFIISSVLAASSNCISLIDLSSFQTVLTSRFLTGLFLAGIYPVGMKIAADWSEKGLGLWLGALVGALVLGTAFPQILNAGFIELNPITIIQIVSLLAIMGGILVALLIPDGPFRKPALRFNLGDFSKVYTQKQVLSAAMGYFGHMWELYAFWAFLPWLIKTYSSLNDISLNQVLLTFIVISMGFIGCVAGGIISRKSGSQKVAVIALAISGICCLISPILFIAPKILFIVILCIWGLAVVADSPQLSALIAVNAPNDLKGSVITSTTCIGFAITIASIQWLSFLAERIPNHFVFLFLAPGPIIGITYLRRLT